MLALLPYLSRGSRVSLTEVAEAGGWSLEELADDLVALSMCGIPPYTPDALVSVWVEGDDIVAWSDPPALEGRVRLSRSEAQALLAALETAGFLPEDPLTQTLMSAAGPHEDLDEAVAARALSAPGEHLFGIVADAVQARRELRIRYFTASRGTTSERVVLPYTLANRGGSWYVVGHCRSADDLRVFRLDRVDRVWPTGRHFEPPDPLPETRLTPAERDDLPEAAIRFEPGEEVDPHDWPGSTIETAEGGVTILHAPFASGAWLARRVVARLGRATVLSPSDMKESVAAMANTLLKRE